eukprot:353628-Prorocentrum_minimum.AAC.1
MAAAGELSRAAAGELSMAAAGELSRAAAGELSRAAAGELTDSLVDERLQRCGRLDLRLGVHGFDHRAVRDLHLRVLQKRHTRHARNHL